MHFGTVADIYVWYLYKFGHG